MSKKTQLSAAFISATFATLVTSSAFAQEAAKAAETNKFDIQAWSAVGAGFAIGIAVLGGALAQGRAAAAALEGISRNPGAAPKIQTPMILGLALIESLVLFAFLIAFLLYGKIGGLCGDRPVWPGDPAVWGARLQEEAPLPQTRRLDRPSSASHPHKHLVVARVFETGRSSWVGPFPVCSPAWRRLPRSGWLAPHGGTEIQADFSSRRPPARAPNRLRRVARPRRPKPKRTPDERAPETC